jgi:uncharacterized protein DUF2568
VQGFKGLLLAVRFGLELAALFALGYWGITTGDGAVSKTILGLGAPLVAAVLWALFVSPKARFQSPLLKVAFELVVFGAAALALVEADRVSLAIVFAVVALIDGVLVRLI